MKKLFVLPLLFLCGMDECNTSSSNKTIRSANPRTLSYIKDDRTNLCFAKYSDGGVEANSTIVVVPCENLKMISIFSVESK